MTQPYVAPRASVEPPVIVPRQYGLLSVVEFREPTSPHWRNGVWWLTTCGDGGLYESDFCPEDAGETKSANAENTAFSASPAVPYVKIDCSAPGFTEAEHQRRALEALARTEELQLESAFWTGQNEGGLTTVFPHLAANAEVIDPAFATAQGVILQMAATTIVTGGSLDIVEGLGRIEAALAECGKGRGVIHMTIEVVEAARAQHLVEVVNGRLQTVLGNLVVAGAGYPGTSPAGASTAGVHWMYATGQIFAYRSTGELLGTEFKQQFDRENNTAEMIAERVYVLGYDCCLFAAPISLGGIVSGTFNSAT